MTAILFKLWGKALHDYLLSAILKKRHCSAVYFSSIFLLTWCIHSTCVWMYVTIMWKINYDCKLCLFRDLILTWSFAVKWLLLFFILNSCLKKTLIHFYIFFKKKGGKGVTSSEFLGFTLILSQLLNCQEESLLHKTLLGKARLASMLSGSIGDIMNWVLTFRH